MKRFPLFATLLAAPLSLTLSGCGGPDSGIQDDGLTIQNPHDGLWQDRDVVPIRFELEQTFGAEEEPVEAVLGSVYNSTVDNDGNVYVFDWRSERLLSFAPDGSLRWATGGPGQGPGEFQFSGRLMWSGPDHLLVANQNNTRLDVFDDSGAFVQTIQIDVDELANSSLVGLIPPDRFVFAARVPGMRGSNLILARLTDQWEMVTRIVEEQLPPRVEMGPIGANAPATVAGDQIIVSHLQEYRLNVYDTVGTLVRTIRRDMHDLVAPGYFQNTDGGASLMPLGGLRPVLRMKEGRLLALAVWPTNQRDSDEYVRRRMQGEPVDPGFRHTIDLFDADGRLLYSLEGEGELPEIGRPEFVDADGRLYTSVSSPYPHIRRYRVVMDE